MNRFRPRLLSCLPHEELRRTGRDGNFGPDDQLTALRWMKAHIADFGGNEENITLLGQSAGTLSSQYLCLNHENEGGLPAGGHDVRRRVLPCIALPRRAEVTHAYWLQVQTLAGCGDFDELLSHLLCTRSRVYFQI